jgi:hypothetical protein
MKTTSNGRQHKNGIAQQALLGFYSNFTLKLGGPSFTILIFFKVGNGGNTSQEFRLTASA